MNNSDILRRIDELLALPLGNTPELSSGCLSLMSLVYGPKSPQLEQFSGAVSRLSKVVLGGAWERKELTGVAQGALRTLKREIGAGLIGNFRQQVTGEVLTDFIQLSRSVLNQSGDGAKSVAAVLAAAAFEDTIRRMGETLAGVVGKDDLSEVLKKLKDAGIIQSPQVGIAQSYLNFRNHALHANWDKIEREAIHSVLGDSLPLRLHAYGSRRTLRRGLWRTSISEK